MTAASGAALRALHRAGDPLVLPNAWDVASALALVDAGFAAIGTTSLGLSAGAGVPDGVRGVRALTADLAVRLAHLPVPVTVDLEDGFDDDPDQVAALVAGLPVAGVNLEDSTGGRLVEPARHAAKVAAVRERCPDVVVNARVDTFWLGERDTVAETVARAGRYVAAGADVVFVPGDLDGATIRVLVRELGVPLNVLATPRHTVRDLAELGVARVSTGSLLYRAALDAAVAAAGALRDGRHPPVVTGYAAVQERPGRTVGAWPWTSR